MSSPQLNEPTRTRCEVALATYWDRQDFDWGYSDGINNRPLPEFLPPPAYFEGRKAGLSARKQQQRDAA